MDIYSRMEEEIRSRLELHKTEERALAPMVYWYGAALLQSHALELSLRTLLMEKLALNTAGPPTQDSGRASRLEMRTLGSLVGELRDRRLLPEATIERLFAVDDKRRRLVHHFFVERITEVLAGPTHWTAIELECKGLVIEIRSILHELVPLHAAQVAALPLAPESLEGVIAKLDVRTDRVPDPS